jgi:pimeloyl-ACP methyl ester carboxylesterase
VVISVNSIRYRIGANRLHTRLARELCDLGYHVFCFDPAGVGDSEGAFEEKPLREHYLDIQNGKYLEDTMDAVTFFLERYELDQLVFLGLCGGAVSMLISAGDDNRANGVVLLAMPILTEPLEDQGAVEEETSTITSEVMAGRVLTTAARKLLDREIWKKILTLRVDWKSESKIARKAVAVMMHRTVENATSRLPWRSKAPIGEAPVSSHPRFNILLQRAFTAVAKRGCPMLFVFAEQDFVTWQFKSEFQDRALPPGNPYEGLYAIHVVENANHVFSAEDSQAKLSVHVCGWLGKHFPVGA